MDGQTLGDGKKSSFGAKAILLLIILLAVVGCAPSGESDATESDSAAEAASIFSDGDGPVFVGDTAVNFTLIDLDGNEVSLSDHAGQPIVLNFWASWCAPCRIEMPELQALHDDNQDVGLVILALNQAESADVARDFFIDEMELTFTNPLLDSEVSVADMYGVRNLPTTVFISADGEITAVHRGPAVQSQFEGYLAQTIETDSN